MIFALMIVGGVLLTLGLCVGWSLAEAALSQRARRQAEFQRRLNAECQALRESRELARLTRFFDNES